MRSIPTGSVVGNLRAQLAVIRDRLFPRPRLCSKKVRYQEAGEARGVLNRRQSLETVPLFLYRCPACDGWHITKMEQSEQSEPQPHTSQEQK